LSDVGRRLAEVRELRGNTQQEVADLLGVSMRYVQAVEAGAENLTLRSLAALASVLHAPVATFFETPSSRVKRRGRPRAKRARAD
jgi:transcriptional regulator with XRE-family HTH domain